MKEQLNHWSDITMNSLQSFWIKVAEFLPSLIGAIFILIIGWLLAKLASSIIRRIFKSLKFNRLKEMINESQLMKNAELEVEPVAVIAKFVYWVILILFFIIASDALGWNVVSEEIGNLFSYLPKLFSAIIIFVIGMYIANFVRQVLRTSFQSVNFVGAKFVSTAAYYIIMIIVTITALSQAGVDTSIINSNLNIIIASVLVAFALSFGLASRKTVGRFLAYYHSGKTFSEGQKVKFEETEGEIISINSTSVIIKTSLGEEVIPVDQFMDSKVRIVL